MTEKASLNNPRINLISTTYQKGSKTLYDNLKDSYEVETCFNCICGDQQKKYSTYFVRLDSIQTRNSSTSEFISRIRHCSALVQFNCCTRWNIQVELHSVSRGRCRSTVQKETAANIHKYAFGTQLTVNTCLRLIKYNENNECVYVVSLPSTNHVTAQYVCTVHYSRQ